jgi:hypothetical protein
MTPQPALLKFLDILSFILLGIAAYLALILRPPNS